MIRIRFAAVAVAAALSLLLGGCVPARLHVLIPDFLANGVDGLRLFRVVAGGGLTAAGRIEFGEVAWTPQGLQMQYTQVLPGKGSWGPLVANVEQPAAGQLRLQLSIVNEGPAAAYRVASFNEVGTSPLAEGSVYVAGKQP
jgi:hypothetical protein